MSLGFTVREVFAKTRLVKLLYLPLLGDSDKQIYITVLQQGIPHLRSWQCGRRCLSFFMSCLCAFRVVQFAWLRRNETVVKPLQSFSQAFGWRWPQKHGVLSRRQYKSTMFLSLNWKCLPRLWNRNPNRKRKIKKNCIDKQIGLQLTLHEMFPGWATKWMFTKRSTLATPQGKCPMLRQQSQKMRFVVRSSQVDYDNW